MRTYRPKSKPEKKQSRNQLVEFLRGQGYQEDYLESKTTRELQCMRARFNRPTGIPTRGKLPVNKHSARLSR
jgi:hypothetical protein